MYLYFIQAGDDGPVKIGLADDPEFRRVQLQTGNHIPLYVLAAIPGTADMERELHRRFASGRLQGEWFDAETSGLREEIAEAVHVEAEVAHARRLCVHCGIRPVLPPRTRVCSDECNRARKRGITQSWNRRTRSKT